MLFGISQHRHPRRSRRPGHRPVGGQERPSRLDSQIEIRRVVGAERVQLGEPDELGQRGVGRLGGDTQAS